MVHSQKKKAFFRRSLNEKQGSFHVFPGDREEQIRGDREGERDTEGEGERESWGEDVNGQRMLSVKTVHTNGAVLAQPGEDLWARCPILL